MVQILVNRSKICKKLVFSALKFVKIMVFMSKFGFFKLKILIFGFSGQFFSFNVENCEHFCLFKLKILIFELLGQFFQFLALKIVQILVIRSKICPNLVF